MSDFIGISDVVDITLPTDYLEDVSIGAYRKAAVEFPRTRFSVFFIAAVASASIVLAAPKTSDVSQDEARSAQQYAWLSDTEYACRIDDEDYRAWLDSLPKDDLDAMVDVSKFKAVRWNGTDFEPA